MEINLISKMEELLALASPIFLLDHYWEVLDLIAWRISVESEDKNHFTFSDLNEKILNDIQISKSNPIRYRECLNSMKVARQVINELVKLGLLIKEDDIFLKSDMFPKFFYFLKTRIKTSLKKRVAWAIWHLYHQKGNSFLTREIVNLLSYSDEEITEEIPHLVRRENNNWFSLLEECQEGWKLVEAPYQPSKSILLVDINYRLHIAILKISKFKDRFSTNEILKKLRELESKSVERTLKRFGLKQEKGEWFIDNEVYEKIRNILLTEIKIEEWPFFGIISSKNPYFKLQSRTMYVDMPNTTIQSFLYELDKITYEHQDNKGKMYEKAKELATIFNREIEKVLGKWFSFIVKKQFFGSKPFGVQIKIDWNQFLSFIDNFPQSELSLGQKYSYILNCRAPSMTLVLRGDLERVQHEVKEICRTEINQIRESIKDLVERVNNTKEYLFKITLYRKTIPIEPSTLQYFPEMISTLQTIIFLVENGTIPACYREMRKVLENLSWVIFDDLLFYKATSLRKRKRVKELPLPPYRSVSKEWYDWATQKKLGIRNLRELEKKVKNLVEMIHIYSKSKGYSWERKQIERMFFNRLSYSLFLLLTGIEAHFPKRLEHLVPCYEVKTLRILAIEGLKDILKGLKTNNYLSKSDKALINKLMNCLETGQSSIVPPYPSNEFVLEFLSKVFSNNLLKLYKEYSHFVHSYFTSWHIFPFSSVLEFKVFRNELFTFTKVILQLLNSYLKQL